MGIYGILWVLEPDVNTYYFRTNIRFSGKENRHWYSKNRETPDWMKCKESLFDQVVFKKCTPSQFMSPKDSFEKPIDDSVNE